jgi:GMP synthase (glutamine-hydrolysing)
MRKHIAVLDCSIITPAVTCYNKLQSHFPEYFFSFHQLPMCGLETLESTELVSTPDGYIIFGSHSNVYQKLDWHLKLVDFIKPKILEGTPVLGICFGHQLVADTFGLTVDKIERENYTFGSSQVTLLKDFGAMKKNEVFRTAYANSYEVKNINDQFIHLGRSNVCEYNMLALKNTKYVGIQSHPEASTVFFRDETPLDEKGELAAQTMREGYRFLESFFQYFQTQNKKTNSDVDVRF